MSCSVSRETFWSLSTTEAQHERAPYMRDGRAGGLPEKYMEEGSKWMKI